MIIRRIKRKAEILLLRSSRPNGNLAYQLQWEYKKEMVPHQSIRFCDQETILLEDISSDSRSKKGKKK